MYGMEQESIKRPKHITQFRTQDTGDRIFIYRIVAEDVKVWVEQSVFKKKNLQLLSREMRYLCYEVAIRKFGKIIRPPKSLQLKCEKNR